MTEDDEDLLRRVLKKAKPMRATGDRIILQIDVSLEERTRISKFCQQKKPPQASTPVS